MAVEIIDLRKMLGGQIVLDGISFKAKAGRVLGFLGPNGAGKTTTLRIITGSILQDGGKVFVNGKETLNNRLQLNRLIGYLPENNPLYQNMYVQEVLLYAAGMFGISLSRDRLIELVMLTGLVGYEDKKVGQLSKGYRQRLGLAQALVADPEVLILDEPTVGLDPNQLIEIRSLIKKLAQKKTIIFSTHILQEVEILCDDVVILNHGKIMAKFSMQYFNALHPKTSLEQFFNSLTK